MSTIWHDGSSSGRGEAARVAAQEERIASNLGLAMVSWTKTHNRAPSDVDMPAFLELAASLR